MMSKNKPIIVDLFCGGGGASAGIIEALGTNIEFYSINHWDKAVETHKLNYPEFTSICQDVRTVIPQSIAKGRKIDLLWASPSCVHFSVARGGKPMDDQERSLPHDVIRWIQEADVQKVIVENVPEFTTWGPLDFETMRPIQEKKGVFFNNWLKDFENAGYEYEWKILNAADYGTPTKRRRFFLQAVKKGCGKIVWPIPTNTNINNFLGIPKWIPVKDVIDWSIPCPPIEDRKKPLSKATLTKIYNGIKKFWKDEAIPFIVRYNGGENRYQSIEEPLGVIHTSNCYGLVQPLLIEYYKNGGCKSVDEPMPTCTTKERFALIQPLENYRIGYRMLTTKEYQLAMGFSEDYKFAGTRQDVVKQIGNAVCPPVAKALVSGY